VVVVAKAAEARAEGSEEEVRVVAKVGEATEEAKVVAAREAAATAEGSEEEATVGAARGVAARARAAAARAAKAAAARAKAAAGRARAAAARATEGPEAEPCTRMNFQTCHMTLRHQYRSARVGCLPSKPGHISHTECALLLILQNLWCTWRRWRRRSQSSQSCRSSRKQLHHRTVQYWM